MNPEEEVKQILRAISEYKESGLLPEELLGMIDAVRPVKVVEVEKEPVTTKEQREYMKEWREERKRTAKIKDRELREADKLEKCLRRTGFMCSKCGRVKIDDPKTNTYQYVQKKNRKRVSIVIINNCPKCQGKIKLFGGYKLDN